MPISDLSDLVEIKIIVISVTSKQLRKTPKYLDKII